MTRPDLCLDFANTRFWRGRPTPTETLIGLPELVAWLAGAGVQPVGDVDALQQAGAAETAALFADSIALRAIFSTAVEAVHLTLDSFHEGASRASHASQNRY